MLSIRLDSLKNTTKHLFLEKTFDFFQLIEASFLCAAAFSIDGHRNPDFLLPDTEDSSIQNSFISWKNIRSTCFQIIKGTQAPTSFRLVFFLPSDVAASFFHAPLLNENTDIEGYLFLFTYKNQILTATSGTSFHRFSMDKESEKLWDKCLTAWLDWQKISYELL